MKRRRLVAIVLIVLGALMLWLAPETGGGVILIVAGIVIEVLGLIMEHRASRSR